jgi:hypothetical protein
VRQSWNDPLGFAGLGKTAPPFRQLAEIQGHREELLAEAADVAGKVAALGAELPRLDLEVRALARSGATEALHTQRADELTRGEAELARLRAREAAIADTTAAMDRELRSIEAGAAGDPQAHLHQPHRPVPPEETRYNVVVELWSAVSIGVLLLFVAAATFFRLLPWWGALLVGIAGYVLIEAALRRRLSILLLRLVLVLAVVTAVLLIFDFRMELVVAAIAALALIVAADNVREISNR